VKPRTTSITAATITAIALLACGSGPLERSVRDYSKAQPPDHDPTALHGRYTVPPDRALLPVRVRVEAPDPDGPSEQVRSELDALSTAVSDLPPCTLLVQDYRPPSRSGDDWVAEAWATLDIDLSQLTTPAERMERIDQCRGAVLPRTTRYAEEVEGTDNERSLSIGSYTLMVDAPEAHIEQLLKRRARTLQAVTPPLAPQLHPEDYRCVPTGEVKVGARSLAGVVLSLGQTCRVAIDEPEPPAEG